MKTLLATLAVGTAVAAAVALPATGQETPATRTLSLTSVQAKGAEHAIDTPPRGDSVGDRFVFASTLRSSGKLVGRMEGDCLAVDLKFEGMQCTLTAVLADGSITLQGASLTKHIPARPRPALTSTPSPAGRAPTSGRRARCTAAATARPTPTCSSCGRAQRRRPGCFALRGRPQPPGRRARSAWAMCSRRTSGPSRSIARTSATWSAPTCSFVQTGLSWLTKSAISVLSAE